MTIQGLLLILGVNMQNPHVCPWPVLVPVSPGSCAERERRDFLVFFKDRSLSCLVVNGVVDMTKSPEELGRAVFMGGHSAVRTEWGLMRGGHHPITVNKQADCRRDTCRGT